MGRPRTASDDDILDAAARAISRAGPGRLTLASVAAEVGITAAAILQRFGSKHGLLLALSRRGTVEAAGAVAAALDAGRRRSPLEALDSLLTAGLESIESAEVLANHVGMLQLDLTDAELRLEARRHAATTLGGIEQLLDRAVAAGELVAPGDGDVHLDCARLADAVNCTYNGALVTWALTPRGPLPRWVREQIAELLRPYRASARS
ncbi:MAG: TetR/AcrR family transcriptional regulator [Acidimicrobiia bacterium]